MVDFDELEVDERDPFDRGDVSPSSGGCWFCHRDDGRPMLFSMEFDTWYHRECAARIGLDPDECDPVLEFEAGRYDDD